MLQFSLAPYCRQQGMAVTKKRHARVYDMSFTRSMDQVSTRLPVQATAARSHYSLYVLVCKFFFFSGAVSSRYVRTGFPSTDDEDSRRRDGHEAMGDLPCQAKLQFLTRWRTLARPLLTLSLWNSQQFVQYRLIRAFLTFCVLPHASL